MRLGNSKVLRHAYKDYAAIHLVDNSAYKGERPYTIETIGKNDAKRYKTLAEAEEAWSWALASGWKESRKYPVYVGYPEAGMQEEDCEPIAYIEAISDADAINRFKARYTSNREVIYILEVPDRP